MFQLLSFLRFKKIVGAFRLPWVRICVAVIVLIFATPLLLQYFETPDSAYSRYFDGVYFTIVTMSTVGYGDISVGTDVGKFIVIFLIICGCAMYAVIIGEGATLVWRRGEAKLKGEVQHKLKNHIVIMEEGSLNVARELFEEILADEFREPRKLMYISTHERNPFHDQGILYTRGDRIYDDDVLKRACIRHADKVIIKGSQDADTFFAAEAVVALNPDIDVTAWVIHNSNVQRFNRLKGNVDVIHPLTAQILCQNMQDKIYFPLESLLTNKQGQEIYMIKLPPNSTALDSEKLHPLLRERYGILLWAIQRSSDPAPIVNPVNITLAGGTLLWVIAKQRPVKIDWEALAA